MFSLVTGIFAFLLCSVKSNESPRSFQQIYENFQRHMFEKDQQNMALQIRLQTVEENVHIKFEEKDRRIQKLEQMLEKQYETLHLQLRQKDKQVIVLERRLKHVEERLHTLEISEDLTEMKEIVNEKSGEVGAPDVTTQNTTLHRGFGKQSYNRERMTSGNTSLVLPINRHFWTADDPKTSKVFSYIPNCNIKR